MLEQHLRVIALAIGLLMTAIGAWVAIYAGLRLMRLKTFKLLVNFEKSEDGQEFKCESVIDKGDFLILHGQITCLELTNGATSVSFCVPPDVLDFRLGYYGNVGYVLIDVSNTDEIHPKAYQANTTRITYTRAPHS